MQVLVLNLCLSGTDPIIQHNARALIISPIVQTLGDNMSSYIVPNEV